MDRYWKTGSILHIGDPMGNKSIELTKEQFDAEMLERAKIEIRAERDRRIQKVEWRVARYQHEELLDLPLTEPLLPILEYIQLLRDIPQQEGFPHDVIFPEEI